MIKTLKIINFRSIKSLTLSVSQLNTIIGPNSTGKTNVLKAIDLLLGEGWTTKAKISRELFCDPDRQLMIEAVFTTPIMVTSNGRTNEIRSVKLVMSITPDLMAKTTVNDNETFWGHEQFKKYCHFVYIPAERNLQNELRVSSWSMLGKLMRRVQENYIDYYGNEDDLRSDFLESLEPVKQFLEKDFDNDKVTFKKFAEKFVEKCNQNSSGLINAFVPSLNMYNLNWFYKTLQIQISESSEGRLFDTDEIGAGMQNLILISIFQTYAELNGGHVIFGIEEPEIYLYPQAQRRLYKSFRKLAENSQIFYTTHNTNFVDAGRPKELMLLRKSPELGTYQLPRDPNIPDQFSLDQSLKIYTNFNQERNEIFFSKKVILVEGASDKIFISTLFESVLDVDLDALGISVVECGGKNGVKYFLGVCKMLGHGGYFAIWDNDQEDTASMPLFTAALSEGKGIEYTPNFEVEFGLRTGQAAEKVKNAFVFASSLTPETIPEKFHSVVSFVSMA